jgi:hypothetical protein
MAPGGTSAALGLSHCNDYMETNPLKLGAEHVPFPCSLRELVLDRYGEPIGAGGNAHPMQLDELLEYIKNIDNFNLSPWVAIQSQIEAMGDPAIPSQEQTAILRWLSKALEIWEQQFPLEGRLAAQVRRLKPLAAALSLTDPGFMKPGTHPLHQLLDSIQARAIGWQSQLGRMGAILEQQVSGAVEESRGWFDNTSMDLAAICSDFSVAADRDQARAQRMVQRVVETEAGRVKTTAAKQDAARMINAALERHLAPEEIGEFLKGPWYTSAQLLLLKFGADSEQWQKMSTTTETLLDSLQSQEAADEARRQYIFEVVTQLPKEMRRWLVSMHHDTEAVNEAMGMVEMAHLRILRRQPLELQRIEPIAVEGEPLMRGEAQDPGALHHWHEGQWCSVDNGAEEAVRVQLVLKIEQSQQLLFTNLAGLKVLQLSFGEFNRLMEQDKVTALHGGASFSLCLAYAVGIESIEILEALVSALADREPKPEPVPEWTPEPEPEPEPEPAEESHGPENSQEQVELEDSLEDNTEEHQDSPDQKEQQPVTQEPETHEGFLSDQAKDIKTHVGFLSDQALDIKSREGNLGQQAKDIHAEASDITEDAGDSESGQGHPTEQEVVQERELNLPMGIWIGFHDGETPLLARLAVHDPEDDYYIFVNRKGVKMRQLGKQELLNLIDKDLVDILETNSSFREEVTEGRKDLDKS